MSRIIVNCVLLGIILQAGLVPAKRPDFVTDEMVAMIKDDKDRCMQEHGTTEALIERVNDGDIPNDKAITCYMYCLFESFSVIDEDGVLEADMLTGFFPEDIQAKGGPILSACASQDGADNCEKVYNIAKCVHSKMPEMWFMV
uniref:Odorant-binding protein 5 n=1 Tax=Aulacocentrum confusum TaxID=2767324 RepID=A0A7G8Z906_9HYME|nr:odorant-binding protein 5 [Aulacocentrum confusum]